MPERLLTFLSRTEVWVGALALASFLVLSWALRGAPIGQAAGAEGETEEGPGGGYRDRVVAAMVGGLLLVLAGGYLALTSRLAWSLPAFALGLGVVLSLILVNRRYRHVSPAMRRTIELAGTMLNVGLVAGILIVANVFAFRFGGHGLDFTREATFSLSSLTLNQLRALKQPVTFTVLFGNSPRAQLQHERVRQMLDLFKEANPERVSIVHLDPYREIQRYQELVKRYPDIGITEGGALLIEYGSESTAPHVVIRNNDLFEDRRGDRFPGSSVRFESSFNGEDAVTTALVRLREGKRSKLALIVGHGEPPTTEIDSRNAGLGVFRSRLSALGYDVVEVNLLQESIPTDAVATAIIGPKTPFKPEEAARLKAAMDAGMPVLAVVGGPEAPGEKSGLEGVFQSFNLAISPSAILDPGLNFRGQPFYVFVPILGTGQIRHPIVASLASRFVLLPRPSPIVIQTAQTANAAKVPFNQAVLPMAILRTSNQSWGETNLTAKKIERDDKDEFGPLIVGVAVTDQPQRDSQKEPKPRLVLFSSRFLADNLFLGIEPTNLDLLVNAINWLRGQAEMGGIGPKTHTVLTLSADPSLRARLILVPTMMAVLLIIGLGLTTYMARRE
jgi:hypothetical protein